MWQDGRMFLPNFSHFQILATFKFNVKENSLKLCLKLTEISKNIESNTLTYENIVDKGND